MLLGLPLSYYQKFSQSKRFCHTSFWSLPRAWALMIRAQAEKPPAELTTSIPAMRAELGHTPFNILKSEYSVPQDMTVLGGRPFTQVTKGK